MKADELIAAIERHIPEGDRSRWAVRMRGGQVNPPADVRTLSFNMFEQLGIATEDSFLGEIVMVQ